MRKIEREREREREVEMRHVLDFIVIYCGRGNFFLR